MSPRDTNRTSVPAVFKCAGMRTAFLHEFLTFVWGGRHVLNGRKEHVRAFHCKEAVQNIATHGFHFL